LPAADPGTTGANTMDTTALQGAYRELLEAADTVADSGGGTPPPPAGEWDADQILAHVVLINAATIAAVTSIASGAIATYDNRVASQSWTIDRVIGLVGGNTGLRERIRHQADALRLLTGPALSEAELDTPVPTLLVSGGTLLVDQPMPLRDIIAGLADVELPGHAEQLRRLRPPAGPAAAEGDRR
jgi:hypothetical protein